MRRIAIFAAAFAALLALGAPARADMAGDCGRSRHPERQLSGCTAIIGSGAYSGKSLAVAYSNRGNARSNLGDYRRAIEDYDQALRLDPGNIVANTNRGIAYKNLGEYHRSIEAYELVLRRDPGNAKAYNGRAWSLYLLGRYAEALGSVERSLSLEPGNVRAIDTYAHVLAALGRPEEALAEFERALRAGGVRVVRMYQRELAAQGYYQGALDGDYGPQTRAALVACLEAGCRVVE